MEVRFCGFIATFRITCSVKNVRLFININLDTLDMDTYNKHSNNFDANAILYFNLG